MKSMKNSKLKIVPPCMVFYIDIYSGVFLGPPCTDMDMMLVPFMQIPCVIFLASFYDLYHGTENSPVHLIFLLENVKIKPIVCHIGVIWLHLQMQLSSPQFQATIL